ncbi:MAG: DIP1984 family protein [Dehalococcoidales bacterium]|jgi:hypothetical protein
MKLSEALIKRADLQKRYAELKNRILNNVQVQEGDTPSEDPEVLIEEACSVLFDLKMYIQMINKTNSRTIMNDGSTITNAIAMRDALKLKHELYSSIASSATITPRFSRSEIKATSVIDVNKYRTLADDTAKSFRFLDTEIQTMNWNTELIEN